MGLSTKVYMMKLATKVYIMKLATLLRANSVCEATSHIRLWHDARLQTNQVCDAIIDNVLVSTTQTSVQLRRVG